MIVTKKYTIRKTTIFNARFVFICKYSVLVFFYNIFCICLATATRRAQTTDPAANSQRTHINFNKFIFHQKPTFPDLSNHANVRSDRDNIFTIIINIISPKPKRGKQTSLCVVRRLVTNILMHAPFDKHCFGFVIHDSGIIFLFVVEYLFIREYNGSCMAMFRNRRKSDVGLCSVVF